MPDPNKIKEHYDLFKKKTPKLPKTVEKPKVINTKPITMEQPKY